MMAVSKPKNPTRRKALAARKMKAAEKVVMARQGKMTPGELKLHKQDLERARERFRSKVRADVGSKDPWKRRAEAGIAKAESEQKVRAAAYEKRGASPASTTEDKAEQEAATGIRRKLNPILSAAAKAARKAKAKK